MAPPKKLTKVQELEVLGRFHSGESQRSLAPQYGVCPAVICQLLKKSNNTANMPAALEAAATYYRMNPNSQNRVTHPARILSDKSSHAMPALALPPAPAAGCSLNFRASIDMGTLCQAARAETVLENGQQAPNLIHEPDAAGQGQSLRLLSADLAACAEPLFKDRHDDDSNISEPNAAGQEQLLCANTAGCASQRLETITGHETEANKGQGTVQAAPSTAQSEFEPVNLRCDDAPQPRRALELDHSLRSRVLQRTRPGEDQDRIIAMLLNYGIVSIDMCLGAHRDFCGLTELGFDQEEANLLVLDDDLWKSTPAWLDSFIASLPEWLRKVHIVEPFKTAVRRAKGINGLEDFFRCYQSVQGIPPLIELQIKLKSGASEHTARKGLRTQLDPVAMDESLQDEGSARNDPPKSNLTLTERCIHSNDNMCETETRIEAAQSCADFEHQVAAVLLSLNTKPQPSPDLGELQRAVHNCMPKDHRNWTGVCGTLQPGPLIGLIVDGISALKTAHDAATAIFVDLGCSCGHAVMGAALSKQFQRILGVDFPENKDAILQSVVQFKSKAAKHKLLSTFSQQFEDVRFLWRHCGNTDWEDLGAVLGEEIQCPAMLYWFCTGWGRDDVQHCAELISRSPMVLGVVCVPRDQGPNAVGLLRDLNSAPGQKRFYTYIKKEKVPYSGNGHHTAYIFLRNRDFEYNLNTRPDPDHDGTVEVLFKHCSSVKWYPGVVKQFNRTNGQLKIDFDDGETQSFAREDPEVVFSPTEDNQWRQTLSGEDEGAEYAFCRCCAEILGQEEESRCCARCRAYGYHLKCLSDQAPKMFLCPFCRAELAEIGRRQSPQFKCSDSLSTKSLCFSCTAPIFKLHKKIQADLCRSCNALFCRSCSSRTSDMSLPFWCPACIGISAHDAALKNCFEAYIDKRLRSIVQPVECKLGGKPLGKQKVSNKQDSARFMDEVGQAMVSLQQTCQWELFQLYLPRVLELLTRQVSAGEDPAIGPFDQINLLGMEGGPKFDLVDRGALLYAQHAKDKASRELQLLKNGIKKKSPPRIVASNEPLTIGIKIGFVTADLRRTPWWQLMRTALQALAMGNTLLIFSRPRIKLDGDPHYVALQALCTLIEFEEGASDADMAECISTYGLDVVIDAGGPTYGSFTGVMALLPDVLRGAHLGYPGTQPGGHIEFTAADQIVLPPGSPQAENAQEAIMFLRCYQPNGSFCTTVSVPPVRSTTRSDWNLPDDAFVFACFCRLGRITSSLMQTFGEILTNTQNSVLWIRSTPLPAAMRIKKCFLIKGIDADRLILACDVPNEEHMERLVHANLILDTHIYGGHTTASDALIRGVPYLVLKGKWWHGLVSTSLVCNMMGDDASHFLCCDLEEFKSRAVNFATTGVEDLKAYRLRLKSKVESGQGICDGESWVRDFVRGITELVRQKKCKCRLTDVFLCDLANKNTTKRSRTFLDAQGHVITDSMTLDPCDSGCAVVNGENELQDIGTKRKSQTNDDRDVAAAAKQRKFDSAEQAVDGLSGPAKDDWSDDESDTVRCTKAEKHRIPWLFDLAKADPDTAREKAYEYLKTSLPAGVEIAQCEKPDGSKMWAIQLPCKVPRISSKTGNQKQNETELPLMYVTKPVDGRGSSLRSGQVTEKGMYITGYDGKYGHGSDLRPGQSISHIVSLSYGLGQHIDSALTPDWKLVEECSLGGKINHSYTPSNVKLVRPDWTSPISNRPTSIYVVARSGGGQHTEMELDYTSGAAVRDHGIPRHSVSEGKDTIDPIKLRYVQSSVTQAMEVLRKVAGYDLLDIRGRGSEGVAVKVQAPGGALPFVVKIGTRAVSKLSRAGVLCEAALMHRAGGQKDASIGIFYPTLCTDIGWGTCAAALLRVSGELVAAIAMECYDMDGSKIWNKLGRRFMEGDDTDLLRDLQSLLRGTIQATVWMHKSGLAHGDLKDSNMLLKVIKETPNDSRIAWCVVEHTKYQIVFGDWGNARWSGQTEKAFHTFAPISHGGQEYCTTNIIDAVNDRDQISPVNARELNSAFGLLLKKPTRYRHPGAGTALFCCPDIQRVFKPGDGVVQRRFDQAADMWALGVLGVCLLAPPGFEQTGQKQIRDVDWAKRLKQASCVAEKQLRAERSSGAQLGGKAMQATLQPEDCGSWIATMVRRHYQQDRWPILSDRLSGEHKSEWQSWLDLLHCLLTYSSEDRLKANDALENPFFFMRL